MLSPNVWRVIAPAAILCSTSVVFAAEEVQGEGGGMPQLDPSTFFSQVFWLVVAFAVLYYLLNKKLLPSIIEVRVARQARIDEDLEEAGRLRTESEVALAAYEKAVSAAHDQANAAIMEAQEHLQAEFTKRQDRVEAEISEKLGAAETSINHARDKALSEVNVVAVEAAQAAVARLIGIDIDRVEAERAVSEAKIEAA